MKNLILIAALAGLALPANATEFTLKVDDQMLAQIGRGLGFVPYSDARPVVDSLNQQIREQQAAAAHAAEEAAKKPEQAPAKK